MEEQLTESMPEHMADFVALAPFDSWGPDEKVAIVFRPFDDLGPQELDLLHSLVGSRASS